MWGNRCIGTQLSILEFERLRSMESREMKNSNATPFYESGFITSGCMAMRLDHGASPEASLGSGGAVDEPSFSISFRSLLFINLANR